MSTDQLFGIEGGGVARPRGFRHDALLYSGPDEFVARTAAFVRDALAADEPVLVAVIEPRVGLLREELGQDAQYVDFIDMQAVGRNPARIIPAWQDWAARNERGGRAFRGIGEPIWRGRSAQELVECQQHEALLNTAFDGGPTWWLLCPYDTTSLDPSVIARAHDTHPGLIDARGSFGSESYPVPEYSRAAMFAVPLPEPQTALYEIAFALDDLADLRQSVGACATKEGVEPRRAEDLALVANELACNSIRHGGGTGTLTMWRDGGELVTEVRDRGLITDPLVGRRKPDPTAQGGAGLWIANLLCDLVQIRSTPEHGTTVRVHVEATQPGDQHSHD